MILVDIQAPCYNVSLRKRGTRCITSKLRGAHLEGSKSQQGAERGVQNSKSKFAPRSIRPLNTRRRVLDPSKGAPQSFGAMQHMPHFLMETQLRGPKYQQNFNYKLYVYNFVTAIFVSHCHFRDLYHHYSHFLRKEKKITGPYL